VLHFLSACLLQASPKSNNSNRYYRIQTASFLLLKCKKPVCDLLLGVDPKKWISGALIAFT
jgi:hypothetical protein